MWHWCMNLDSLHNIECSGTHVELNATADDVVDDERARCIADTMSMSWQSCQPDEGVKSRRSGRSILSHDTIIGHWRWNDGRSNDMTNMTLWCCEHGATSQSDCRRETNKQTDRKADSQAGKDTERQTVKETNRETARTGGNWVNLLVTPGCAKICMLLRSTEDASPLFHYTRGKA